MKKYALITGGTGGIGLETAKTLGKAGYDIIINGISEEQGEKALAELKELGIEAELFLFDVTNEEMVNEKMDAIAAKYGHLDVLINNAGGLGGRSRFEDMETASTERSWPLTLTASSS